MMKTTSAEVIECNSIVSMSIAIKLDQTVYLCLTGSNYARARKVAENIENL